MRTRLYLALAASLGALWHSVLHLVLLALDGLGLDPTPLPLLDDVFGWDALPLVTSMLTSLVVAALLRRFVARGRLLPVSLGFWTLGGALWPLVWMLLATGVDALRMGWGAALADGEVLFLALVAPYLGLALSAALIWIVWPLAALEVGLLARVLGPQPAPLAEQDEDDEAALGEPLRG